MMGLIFTYFFNNIRTRAPARIFCPLRKKGPFKSAPIPKIEQTMSLSRHPSSSGGGEYRCGLLPVRCYSCNRVLGTTRMHERYAEWLARLKKATREREARALARLVRQSSIAPAAPGAAPRPAGGQKRPPKPGRSVSFIDFMGLRGRFCCARTILASSS